MHLESVFRSLSVNFVVETFTAPSHLKCSLVRYVSFHFKKYNLFHLCPKFLISPLLQILRSPTLAKLRR